MDDRPSRAGPSLLGLLRSSHVVGVLVECRYAGSKQ